MKTAELHLITAIEADVLNHALRTGRYVTDDPRIIYLAEAGFLRDFGPQALAGGDHYLVITAKGRSALDTWSATQPKPKKRRVSAAFESWERYQDACGRIPFSHFWKNIWPLRKGYLP